MGVYILGWPDWYVDLLVHRVSLLLLRSLVSVITAQWVFILANPADAGVRGFKLLRFEAISPAHGNRTDVEA